MSALVDIDAATAEHQRAWARDVGLLPSGVHPARKQRLVAWLDPFVRDGLAWKVPQHDVCRLFEAMRQPRGGQKQATIPTIYASNASRQRYGAPAIDPYNRSPLTKRQLRDFLIALWPYMLLAYCFESDSSDPDVDPNEPRPAAMQRYFDALQAPQGSATPKPKRQRPRAAQVQRVESSPGQSAEEIVQWSKAVQSKRALEKDARTELKRLTRKRSSLKSRVTRFERELTTYVPNPDRTDDVNPVQRSLDSAKFALSLFDERGDLEFERAKLDTALEYLGALKRQEPNLDDIAAIFVPLHRRTIFLQEVEYATGWVRRVGIRFSDTLGVEKKARLDQFVQTWKSRIEPLKARTAREAALADELQDAAGVLDEAGQEELDRRAGVVPSSAEVETAEFLYSISRNLGPELLATQGAPLLFGPPEQKLEQFYDAVNQLDRLLTQLGVAI